MELGDIIHRQATDGARLVRIEEKLTRVEHRFDSVDSRLDAVQTVIGQMGRQLDRIEAKLDGA